eukprot:TRINITY_DN15833_c0_g1_i1.p1 TRINITY_DN15833_c0_g1~~TRINITY_DN15833_c0_g1_i1.p1  ORF type:complete len:211 (+),score=32.43 TRINITY_DN15833_c0_g1_i1:25-657(+)
MFLLMRYALRKASKKHIDRKICILGLDNSGKSAFLNQIRLHFGEPTFELVPTSGQNLTRIDYDHMTLTFWDLAGRASFRNDIWESYFQDIDLLVWVIDSSDRTRFRECKEELDKILKNELLVHVPILVLANKQDIEFSAQQEEIEKFFNISEIMDRKTEVISTSFAGAPSQAAQHEGSAKSVDWMLEILRSDSFKERTEWRKSRQSQMIV